MPAPPRSPHPPADSGALPRSPLHRARRSRNPAPKNRQARLAFRRKQRAKPHAPLACAAPLFVPFPWETADNVSPQGLSRRPRSPSRARASVPHRPSFRRTKATVPHTVALGRPPRLQTQPTRSAQNAVSMPHTTVAPLRSPSSTVSALPARNAGACANTGAGRNGEMSVVQNPQRSRACLRMGGRRRGRGMNVGSTPTSSRAWVAYDRGGRSPRGLQPPKTRASRPHFGGRRDAS
ncbi:hypothetical protein OF83DRAFT_1141410 [Amylostereum chailletii]|nr:hypothetical protein OF83DRAFT_1141410 [Amylostereum chailletii]